MKDLLIFEAKLSLTQINSNRKKRQIWQTRYINNPSLIVYCRMIIQTINANHKKMETIFDLIKIFLREISPMKARKY